VRHLLIEPELRQSEDRWTATTPLIARALWLFSYRRRVTIDRRRGQLRIDTWRFWLAASTRVVPIARIERIVCEAQALPTGFSLLRFFYGPGLGFSTDLAMYYIALRLRDDGTELPLFTLIESQPADDGVLARLTGAADETRTGDEGVARFLTELHTCLGLAGPRSTPAGQAWHDNGAVR
jgi:hypothetical protein